MASDWQRALVTLTVTVVTVVVVALLYWARSIFIPVALAIFLAFVLGPVVAWLQRHRFGRTPAVILTVGLVVVTTLGIGTAVALQVSQLADTLPDRKEAITEKVAAAKRWVVGDGNSRFGQLIDDVSAIIAPPKKPDNTTTVVVEPASPSLTSQLDTYVSPAAEMLGQAAFTFILTIYMLLRREDLRNRMIRLLGHGHLTTTTRAVDDASHRISRYLLTQLAINTVFGLIITAGLFLLGVKYALLWGLIATVMRYVPYVGTWIGLLPPVLFSFATAPEWGGGWGQPIAVFALFLGLEAICNNIFEPWLYGASMGLSEVAQLIAAGFWAFLWGPIGLILSGPLTVCLLVLGKYVRRFEVLEVLLGDEPALEPKVAFYQRLTARDQDEAATVALAEAKDGPPIGVFDSVIIPALCLAKRDHDAGDLEAADLRFALRAAREVGEEVADLKQPTTEAYTGEKVRILLCPAKDEADHVAADLFVRTLNPAKWEVEIATDETLASELVEKVAEHDPAVVVLTALPPGGLSHCRYLVTKIRNRFPGIKILVGRWGEGDDAGDQPRLGISGSDGVDRTLGETRKRLLDMHAVHAANDRASSSGVKPEPVGTASA